MKQVDIISRKSSNSSVGNMSIRVTCFIPTIGVPYRQCVSSKLSTSNHKTRLYVSGRSFVRPYRLEQSRREDPTPSSSVHNGSSVRMSSESSTGPTMKILSLVVLAGFVISTLLPAVGIFRNLTTDAGSAILESQLRQVPVFTVTDESGRPLLTETEDHRLRRGYFFMQYTDAEEYMKRVKESSSDAKVLTVGLNEAVKYLDTRAAPAKSIPERFELFPDDHEVELARQVTNGNFERTFGNAAVPVFYIEGLAVKDDKDQVVYPLFFEKEKLDEMVNELRRRDPKTSLSLEKLQVIDLRQTIEEIRTGANPRLNRVIFIPLDEATKAMNAQAASRATVAGS